MDNYNNMNDQNELSKKGDGFAGKCFEIMDTLVTIAVLLVLIIGFLFRMANVDGQSMMDTLHDGDKLFITQLFYDPKPGDVVVISKGQYLNKPLVKRVIAVEGQTLDINFETGDVKVDGKIIDEPYIKDRTTRKEDGVIPSKIPEGYVFVMGDNRNNSADSRSKAVGLIDKNNILGKAEWIVWGKGEGGISSMFSRFGGIY